MTTTELLVLGYVAIGGLLWLYVITSSDPFTEGNPIGWIGFFSDLTGPTHLLFLVFWPLWFPLWLIARSKAEESERNKTDAERNK
jgi:hypothetical protein